MTSPSPFHPLASDPTLRRRLVKLAQRWLHAGNDAEDLVQETYLRTADAGAPEHHGHEAWMVTVLRNLCIDVMRRRTRYDAILADHAEAFVPGATDAGPEAWLDGTQDVERALRVLVGALPAGDVATVLLHEVFGFDHAQLGVIAGRNEAASRQHLRRLLLRVRAAGDSRDADRTGECLDREGNDATDLVALCRLAVTRRDPAGLIATLRVSRPMALAAGSWMSLGEAA
ncbi:RNA polymerase sigma factor [Bacillus sp. NP157]|nr:RNA polymerase sigma factor [Bacillus sp. NP157]